MRLFLLTMWTIILNAFVFPIVLYGPTMVPHGLGKEFAIQIFLAIISPIYLVAILDWIFEE